MPAPKAIVTFIDADGDEFPIATTHNGDEPDGVIVERAYRELERHIADGNLSPCLPLTTEIETAA